MALLLAALLLGLSGGPVRGSEETLTYNENSIPKTIELPAGARSPVRLFDDLTGLEIPLSGNKETVEQGAVRIEVPQLPPGVFSVKWDGGGITLTVQDNSGSAFAYSTRGGESGGRNLLLVGAVLAGGVVVAVLLRRRRGVAVLLLVGSVTAAGTLWMVSGETAPTYGQAAWSACDIEQNPEIKLNCKVEALLDHIEAGRFDDLRELVTSNRDPVCHEVAHRASFHTWRLTRDRDLVKKILIPGCDDGLIHGVAESIATFTGDGELARELVEFCSSADEDYQLRACLHGGGHATIWRTNGDIERAWEICRQIPKDSVAGYDASEECLGSAVMEWSDRWSAEKGQKNSGLRPVLDEPMELCLRGPETYVFRLGCYMGTNHRTGAAAKAANWCVTKETAQVDACFSALGENLPYYESPRVYIELVPEMAVNHAKNCLGAPGVSARDACMSALSRVFTVMKVSKTLGMGVCDAVHPDLRAACLDGIKEAELKFEQRGIELP